MEHLFDHAPLSSNVPSPKRLKGRDQTRILDHVLGRTGSSAKWSMIWLMRGPATHRHEVGRVAADGIEFDPGVPHELSKGIMSGEAHAMAVSLERRAKSKERLHVALGTQC